MKLLHYNPRRLMFSPIGIRTRFWGGDSGGDTQTTQGSTSSTTTPFFVPQPQTPQQQQALGTWSNTLQDWSKQPGYGAIQPDWSTIWNDAQNKINQTYYGSPTAPGSIDVMKSDAAARGMSDSPALQANLNTAGANYGNTMMTEASNQAVNKYNIEAQGQNNWLNSIMQLAQTQQPGAWGNTSTGTNDSMVTKDVGTGTALGNLGSGIVSTLNSPSGSQNWLSQISNLLKSPGGPAGTAQSGITTDNYDYMSDPNANLQLSDMYSY